MLKFICPLICVEDITRSRHFYEDILGQQVLYDFTENITFKGDFAIHLKGHFQGLLGKPEQYPFKYKGEPMESVVQRFHKQGLSIEDICERTSMPVEFVKKIITERDK